MSRSYKKHPFGGDNKHNKRIANHKVRNFLINKEDLLQGSNYKKCFPRYDICDFWGRCTFQEFCSNFRSSGDLSNKENYKKWLKYYKRK